MFSIIFLFAHKQINTNLLLSKQCNSQSFLLNWNSPNCKYLGCSGHAWIASLQIQFSLVSNTNVFPDNHNTQTEASHMLLNGRDVFWGYVHRLHCHWVNVMKGARLCSSYHVIYCICYMRYIFGHNITVQCRTVFQLIPLHTGRLICKSAWII
jgi:hypothetical protein